MGLPRTPGAANTTSTGAATNPPTSGTNTTAGNRNAAGTMDFSSMLQQMNIVSALIPTIYLYLFF